MNAAGQPDPVPAAAAAPAAAPTDVGPGPSATPRPRRASGAPPWSGPERRRAPTDANDDRDGGPEGDREIDREGDAKPGRPARRATDPGRSPGGPVRNEPAFVLHSTPWRETSLVVELFSRGHGRVPVIARGAKRPRSAIRAVLLAFQPLTVGWSGRGELRNLTGAEWVGGLPSPQGGALLSAFYLNELLVKLLPRDDPHPELFDAYVAALGALAHDVPVEPTLRRFERALLVAIGYGADLARDADGRPIDPRARYGFDPARGWIPVASEPRAAEAIGRFGGLPGFEGAALRALDDGQFDDPRLLGQMKALTRMMLNSRLEGRPLATRQILIDLQRL